MGGIVWRERMWGETAGIGKILESVYKLSVVETSYNL